MRTTCIFLFVVTAMAFQASWFSAGDSATDRAVKAWPSGAQSADDASDKLIVHEWGTFTTFSGSDGLFLDFRPLASEQSDLPDFVLNRASKSPQSLFSKSRIRGKVRMETPITYFYTDQIREVNVRVSFPEGLLTEFYPPVREMLPPFDPKTAFNEGEPLGNSSLDWGKVTLIPISQLVPGIENPGLREQVSRHLAEAVVPHGSNDQHYVQARATDSALVHVRGTQGPNWLGWQPPDQNFMEKFLFYRGVGRFELPVRAVFDSEGRVAMQNDGQRPLTAAILIKVESGTIAARVIGRMGPNESLAFEPTREMTLEELSTVVNGILIAEGLYAKEAASMVETWKQSWFSEEGTRVLYIVPEQITDALLPLTIEPSPDQTLRVLVGRMEIMTPDAEQRLISAVRVSSQARTVYLEKPADYRKQNAFAVSDPIRSFGRMTEPALVRVSKIAKDAAVRKEAEQLIAQLRAK